MGSFLACACDLKLHLQIKATRVFFTYIYQGRNIGQLAVTGSFINLEGPIARSHWTFNLWQTALSQLWLVTRCLHQVVTICSASVSTLLLAINVSLPSSNYVYT